MDCAVIALGWPRRDVNAMVVYEQIIECRTDNNNLTLWRGMPALLILGYDDVPLGECAAFCHLIAGTAYRPTRRDVWISVQLARVGGRARPCNHKTPVLRGCT